MKGKQLVVIFFMVLAGTRLSYAQTQAELIAKAQSYAVHLFTCQTWNSDGGTYKDSINIPPDNYQRLGSLLKSLVKPPDVIFSNFLRGLSEPPPRPSQTQGATFLRRAQRAANPGSQIPARICVTRPGCAQSLLRARFPGHKI